MMVFGICGMVSEVFVTMMRGHVDGFSLMLFGTWAVVAVCGAIRRRDSG